MQVGDLVRWKEDNLIIAIIIEISGDFISLSYIDGDEELWYYLDVEQHYEVMS